MFCRKTSHICTNSDQSSRAGGKPCPPEIERSRFVFIFREKRSHRRRAAVGDPSRPTGFNATPVPTDQDPQVPMKNRLTTQKDPESLPPARTKSASRMADSVVPAWGGSQSPCAPSCSCFTQWGIRWDGPRELSPRERSRIESGHRQGSEGLH